MCFESRELIKEFEKFLSDISRDFKCAIINELKAFYERVN